MSKTALDELAEKNLNGTCSASWRDGTHEICVEGKKLYCRACGVERQLKPVGQPVQPQRDALWCAIYVAAFVRAADEVTWNEEGIRDAATLAQKLADLHHDVVTKEER